MSRSAGNGRAPWPGPHRDPTGQAEGPHARGGRAEPSACRCGSASLSSLLSSIQVVVLAGMLPRAVSFLSQVNGHRDGRLGCPPCGDAPGLGGQGSGAGQQHRHGQEDQRVGESVGSCWSSWTLSACGDAALGDIRRMADVVPRDGPPPRHRRAHHGGLAGRKIRHCPVHRSLVADGFAAARPGDGCLRRDERHDAAGLIAVGLFSTCACLPAGGVRAVPWLAAPMPGHFDGELGTGGDVQLGEYVREVGLHGPV